MEYKLSEYLVCTEPIQEQSGSIRLLFSTRTGLSMALKSSIWDDLEKQDFDLIEPSILDELVKSEILVSSEENEFDFIFGVNKHKLKDNLNGILSFTIQPSANCQLGCHYCGQVHKKESATLDIQQKIYDRIYSKALNTDNVKGISTTWYGGEPLLAYSQIKNLSAQIIALCKDRKIGYSSSIITNGLSLKPHVFKELYLENKVTTFQITIDTTKEHHDKRRITKEGKSTYDIIMNNISNIIQLPDYQKYNMKPIAIRMNIDQTNYRSVKDFIDELVELGFQDKVIIYFAPIINWGDLEFGTTEGLDKDEFAQLEIEWMYYAHQKGFTQTDILPQRSYTPCMVVDKNAEVYDAYGNIYPCYEFSYTPYYTTDEFTIGNLSNPEETYNQNVKTRDWYDSELENGTSGCKECKFFPVCGGGCVKKWYEGEPGCPPFKFNTEERLMLDYLIRSEKKQLELTI
jgi:uncharacterized protein